MYKLGGIGKKSHVSKMVETRFIEPAKSVSLPAHMVTWRSAFSAAKDLGEMTEGRRVFAILSGRFIFCDFIAAILKEYGYVAEKMIISTLGMSADNVGTLGACFDRGLIKSLDLIVSGYFFNSERNAVIPIAYEELDKENRFQLAVADCHTKIVLIKTECGKHIVIHGSANLRTIDNIEQIVIEESKELYDFNESIHSAIVEEYKTINKPIRGEKLWAHILTTVAIPTAEDSKNLEEKPSKKQEPKQLSVKQRERLLKERFKAGA